MIIFYLLCFSLISTQTSNLSAADDNQAQQIPKAATQGAIENSNDRNAFEPNKLSFDVGMYDRSLVVSAGAYDLGLRARDTKWWAEEDDEEFVRRSALLKEVVTEEDKYKQLANQLMKSQNDQQTQEIIENLPVQDKEIADRAIAGYILHELLKQEPNSNHLSDVCSKWREVVSNTTYKQVPPYFILKSNWAESSPYQHQIRSVGYLGFIKSWFCKLFGI